MKTQPKESPGRIPCRGAIHIPEICPPTHQLRAIGNDAAVFGKQPGSFGSYWRRIEEDYLGRKRRPAGRRKLHRYWNISKQAWDFRYVTE